MGKTIKVTISPVGSPKVEAIGFNGVGCADATKAIETALAGTGAGNTETQFKPEYHNIETEGVEQKITW